MLSKCANPACFASFRYLHVGRIFTLLSGPELRGAYAVWDHAVEHHVERFWLCEACSQTMTVCRVNDRVVVRRLPPRPRATSGPAIAA
ncbi:MAG: hypothetical protein LAN64_01130 [Acidobacteriia bacterium]|nr:hypothetical protein [Terriglobia bacterium]